MHGYHHTPIGSMEDLDKATIQDVRDFFNTFYKPNNATLVIVGDFDSAQALAWTNKYFDGIPASAKPIPRLDNPEPPQTDERVVKKSYSEYAAAGGCDRLQNSGSDYAPDAYPLDLASNILAGGESSRLYQTMVYKQQIAVQAAGFGAFYRESQSLLGLRHHESGPHGGRRREIHGGGARRAEKPSRSEAKELEKAKNQEIAGFVLGRDTDEEKAVALASAAVIGKDPGLVEHGAGSLSESQVAADIQRVAKDYFQSTRSTVLIVTPAAPAQQ